MRGPDRDGDSRWGRCDTGGHDQEEATVPTIRVRPRWLLHARTTSRERALCHHPSSSLVRYDSKSPPLPSTNAFRRAHRPPITPPPPPCLEGGGAAGRPARALQNTRDAASRQVDAGDLKGNATWYPGGSFCCVYTTRRRQSLRSGRAVGTGRLDRMAAPAGGSSPLRDVSNAQARHASWFPEGRHFATPGASKRFFCMRIDQ